MKGFLLAVVLFMSFGHISAQSLPQSYISFSAGISNPIGAFAGTNDPYSQGFATPGGILAIDFTKYYAHLGYSAAVSFAGHKLNEPALAHALSIYDIVPFYSKNQWISSSAMFGPAYGYRFGRWTFDVRLMGGVYFAEKPSVRFAQGIELDIARKQVNSDPYAATLGGQAGLCARYNFSEHWFVNARTNFYYAMPYYTIRYPAINSNYQPALYSYNRPSSVMDFTIGLGYGLGKLH